MNDTGVRDYSFNALAGWDLGKSQSLFARAERYTARDAGFGYVANADLGATGAPSIQITYPDQDVSRYSLGWRALALGSAVADRVEVTTYLQNNTRHLNLDVFIPFGGGLPATAGVSSQQRNWTDLSTVGFRAEASKAIGNRTVLTYGADAFRDRSENTDSSLTVVTGFGPPQSQVSNRPQIPNATFRSGGLFAQSDIRVVDRVSLIVGGRVQDVLAKTRETPNLTSPLVESHDRTAVGTANLLVRAAVGPQPHCHGGARLPLAESRRAILRGSDAGRLWLSEQQPRSRAGDERQRRRRGAVASRRPVRRGVRVPEQRA